MTSRTQQLFELPFKTGEPVTGADLIGRVAELDRLRTLVIGMGQDVAIIAPRRFGKTSLVLEFLNRCRNEGYFTASVDLFWVSNKLKLAQNIVNAVLKNSRSKLLFQKGKELLEALLHAATIKGSYDDLEIDFGFDLNIDEDNAVDKALLFPEEFARVNNKRLIFFFDEFSDIAKLNGEQLLKKMRAAFQMHTFAVYVFAGSQESMMRAIFSSDRQPFFRFADTMILKELDEPSVRHYVLTEFERMQVILGRGVLKRILEVTNCHPYYVKLLCKILYLIALKNNNKMRAQDIDYAVKEVLSLQMDYFDEILARFKEENLLKEIKRLVTEEYAVKDIPFAIKYSGLLFIEGESYRFSDPMFHRYVLQVL